MTRPKNEQLTLLAQQGFSDPSRDMPLPGNGNAVDRFQHAACYAALLPEPADVRQALAVDELKLDDDSDRWISIRTTPH